MAVRDGSTLTALASSPARQSTTCVQRASRSTRTSASRMSIEACAAEYPTCVMASSISSDFRASAATTSASSAPSDGSSPSRAKTRSTWRDRAPPVRSVSITRAITGSSAAMPKPSASAAAVSAVNISTLRPGLAARKWRNRLTDCLRSAPGHVIDRTLRTKRAAQETVPGRECGKGGADSTRLSSLAVARRQLEGRCEHTPLLRSPNVQQVLDFLSYIEIRRNGRKRPCSAVRKERDFSGLDCAFRQQVEVHPAEREVLREC